MISSRVAVEIVGFRQYALAYAYMSLPESSSQRARHGEKKADLSWWFRASCVSDEQFSLQRDFLSTL
jgi:hypothetical protein